MIIKSKSPSEEREVQGVSVRVCLRRVFGSSRARVLVRVSREEPVRSLARRLQELFPAEVSEAPNSVLVSAGCVLPPDEPLAILAPGDLVEVIPLHKDYGDEDEREFYKKFMTAFTGKPPVQQKCVRSEIQNCVDTPIDLVPRLESDITQPGHEIDSSEELLREMKRRALVLLDECSENSALSHAAGTEERNKRRRRRVRRRRPLSSLSPEIVCVRSSPVQSLVQQNAGATTRTARCVRA